MTKLICLIGASSSSYCKKFVTMQHGHTNVKKTIYTAAQEQDAGHNKTLQ